MQWASDGRYTRMISAFLLTTWSMKPGSWCVKPLWSCRQTWEERRMLREAIGRRQGMGLWSVSSRPADMRRDEDVEGGDRPPPGNRACDLQPLGVLVEHRVDDVDEGLIG